MRKLNVLYSLLAILLSPFAMSGEMTREKASLLMAECQSQRTSGIAPLKEQAIADCISKKSGSEKYCERYNENFGENRRVRGVNRPGMFWDLPVCQHRLSRRERVGLRRLAASVGRRLGESFVGSSRATAR